MNKFKVGDEVVVRSDSTYFRQRKYGKAIIEEVFEPGCMWDVSARYGSNQLLYYKLHDLDKVVKFKGNK